MSDQGEETPPVDTLEEQTAPPEEELKKEAPTTPSIETKAYEWLSAGTSWGTSWLQSAKEKTLSTMELVKKDLTEFTDVMTHETTALANAAKEGVRQQAQFVKELVSPDEEQPPMSLEEETSSEGNNKKPVTKSDSGFGWVKSIGSSLVDTVKSLAVEDTVKGEEAITEAIRPHRIARSTVLSTVRLHEIATSESTFLDAPEEDEAVAFEEFMKKFRMEEYDAEMSSLLATNPPMRSAVYYNQGTPYDCRLVYSNLVPSQVDNATFWTRYFFKVEQAELNEQLKNSLSRELSVDVNSEKKETPKQEKISRKNSVEEASPSSDDSLSVVSNSTAQNASPHNDETWSICSKEEEDKEETEEKEKDKGPLTPKAEDKGEWVDWDE